MAEHPRSLALVLVLCLVAFNCCHAPPPPGGGQEVAAASPAAPGQVATPASPDSPPTPVRLTVNCSARGSSHSVTWFANEGGYFREQGLDVELTCIPATSLILQTYRLNDLG